MIYLDRNEMAFRHHERNLLDQNDITVYRPWNRIYPQKKWYKTWEVIRARVIDIPWSDKENIPPVFNNEVKLLKIINMNIIKDKDVDNPLVINNLKSIYTDIEDFTILTKIQMRQVLKNNLFDNSSEIKKLYEEWVIQLAQLPEDNVTNLNELLDSEKFSISFVNHDYAAITPKMRNFIAKEYWLDIKSSMAVIKLENLNKIFEVLRKNNKYIWWWLWVWFKDKWREFLNSNDKYFVNPIADAMQSTNFIAHLWDEIHWYNSDATWYCESLVDKFNEIWKDIIDKTIIILGAWWTARGIALELVHRWVKKIIILNRTLSKAQSIVDNLVKIKPDIAVAKSEESIFDIKDDIDAIINLTTKWADWEFEEYSWLVPAYEDIQENLKKTKKILEDLYQKNPKLIISDINLTRTWTTPLLDIAKHLWLPTLDWKAMVVYQWVDAIRTVFWDRIIQKWWTKEEVREKLIKKVLEDKTNK